MKDAKYFKCSGPQKYGLELVYCNGSSLFINVALVSCSFTHGFVADFSCSSVDDRYQG